MIREKERELDGEKRRKRKTEESQDLACNNMPGKLIPVKLVNQERIESERGFSSSIESRGNPGGLFTQEERRTREGALLELSVPMTSRVYFSAAQLYSRLRGDGVRVFHNVYVSHSSTRDAYIHIIVERR